MVDRSRADARRHWPGALRPLAEETSDDLRAETTAEQRLAVMWELAVRAWALAGRPMPTYSRGETPGVLTRPPR